MAGVANLSELDALLGVLKKHGVRRYRSAEISITLGPVEPIEEVGASSGPMPSPTLCQCGHPKFEHGEAGCLQACNPVVCAAVPRRPDGRPIE